MAPSGHLIWVKHFASANNNIKGQELALDTSGGIFVAGTMSGIVDLDPGATTYTMYGNLNNGFLLKLDSLGNLSWARGF